MIGWTVFEALTKPPYYTLNAEQIQTCKVTAGLLMSSLNTKRVGPVPFTPKFLPITFASESVREANPNSAKQKNIKYHF